MRSSLWFVIACAGPLATGCAGWFGEPVGYVEVTSAPVADIEVYPQTVYEGRTVYLYNDRWYYRQGSSWRYYRQEPPPLVQQRQRFRTQPPPRHQEQRREEHPGGPPQQQHGPQQQQHDEHGRGH